MELKRGRALTAAGCELTFNRTRMELKQPENERCYLPPASFNRTRMELKLTVDDAVDPQGVLLIVPEWN